MEQHTDKTRPILRRQTDNKDRPVEEQVNSQTDNFRDPTREHQNESNYFKPRNQQHGNNNYNNYNRHNNQQHGDNSQRYSNHNNHRDRLDDCNEQLYNNENIDFKTLLKKEGTLRGVYSFGYKNPSKIQALSLPIMTLNKDLIAQSQSGTGKTGAFALAILEIIDETIKMPQALILANTGSLALQISSVITELGKYLDIQCTTCCKEVRTEDNMKTIRTSHIIVGTPGRIIHMMRDKMINMKHMKICVIDEADQLLNDEFLKQTTYILGELTNICSICIFSATLPREILEQAERFMKNPEKILVRKEKLSLQLIGQYYIDTDNDENKLQAVEDLYSKFLISQSIIYVSSIIKAKWLSQTMKENNFTVGTIHSDMSVMDRVETMKQFRAGKTRVLISTDLTARGIDIQQVGVVINYDMPYDNETYLHRIGRSGRFNKKGIAISLIGSKKERYMLNDISNFYRIHIDTMPDVDVLNAFLAS